MFGALAEALAFFYEVWPSFGGSIVLFSLVIMLALSPLSIKSTRSMIRMQRVQPELRRLQQEYKGDREALNREMMAFYQANNINPFSSCLPLLLQAPVFIVLYRVLTGLTKKAADGTFDPNYLDRGSKLYNALSGAREMKSFGMDLARSATGVLQDDGVVEALPYILLIALVAGTTYYQQRQIAGRNPAASNPQQQLIGRILPFVMVPITLSLPAGVVIYFVVSNAVRVGQQALVTRLEFGGGQPAIITPPPTKPADGDGAARRPPARDSGRVTRAGAPQRRRKKRK